MTRVLHVYRTYFPDPPGGLQEAIRQMALSTSEYGIENTIFTLSSQPEPRLLFPPEAKVVRCRSYMAPASCDIGGPDAFNTFSMLAKETDVLHYLFPWPFADVLNEVVRPGRPAVLTYISDVVRQRWLGSLYAPLMWLTLKKMRVLIANSPAYARTSPVLSHPELRDKVRVIPLGIDENFYSKAGDDGIFERLNLLKDEPYFLFIGVLRYYKGLDFLIKAAQKFDAPIVIAGTGPEEKRLHALVEELNINNMLFAGQVTDAEKISLLKNCRALVLPSHLRSEAFGMVLVEAAMFARPLISCEIGTGTSYVNKHEETGFVVEPESSDAIADAMNQLLVDENLANNLGKAARRRYEALFSGSALGKAYSELFDEIA
ncbi:MAG: glycosyltransferase [Methylomicrobium sp.]|nr:glycosyltransferase [Methylomicrobium sp.]